MLHFRIWELVLCFIFYSISYFCAGNVAFASVYEVNTFGELGNDFARPEAEEHARTGDIDEKRQQHDNNETKQRISNPSPSLECGIWLAPSALKGAGLGMFAGISFKEGDMMQQVGDLCVPIADIVAHNRGKGFRFLWDEYTWDASSLGMSEEGLHEINGASPGFGSAANSFIPLVNVDELSPRRDYVGLHRSNDPGVGAFTPYFDRRSVAERDIDAGEELYVSYGEPWFEGRLYLGPIPLRKDLGEATILFKTFSTLRNRLESSVPSSVFDDLWDTFVRNSTYNYTSRVFGSFHHDDKEELAELEKGKTVEQLRRRDAVRSQEWLERYGTCGDHIRAGPSTLGQAGHGAFANRNLPEGTTIAQLPLIHITNRSVFNMYSFDFSEEEEPYSPDFDSPRPPQLLLNYCFGHRESSLLLCPYGPMVSYINHNQTMANVRIQWADPDRGNFMPHLLNSSLKALDSDPTAKLAFELVATRPIQEGEEIFLDYGDEWEDAWQRHVESWTPVDGAQEYKSADALNAEIEARELEICTEFEMLEHGRPGHPPNVDLACNNFFSDEMWIPGYENGKMLEELEEYKEEAEYLYCSVLRKAVSQNTGETLYTVEARNDEDTRSYIWEDAPIEMFHFLDKPYSTDIFLMNAFRHDIRIPDSMFPDAWRNISPYKDTTLTEENTDSSEHSIAEDE